MKYLILILLLSACGKERPDPSIYGNLTITTTGFRQTDAPFLKQTVEVSMVYKDGDMRYLSSTGGDGRNLFYFDSENKSLQLVDMGRRFSYIMEYQGFYYNFYLKSTSTGDIFVSKSSDLLHWKEINNSQPVLTQSQGTIYQSIWNVAVTVDDNGLWHLLAETSAAGNDTAGLAYSTATMNGDSINFDANKSSNHLVQTAGNPWLKFITGKGFLVFYGKYNSDLIWEIKAGILDNSAITENADFKIFETGIHICDPHLEETQTGTMMVLSYDQHAIYQLKTSQTLAELFEEIK